MDERGQIRGAQVARLDRATDLDDDIAVLITQLVGAQVAEAEATAIAIAQAYRGVRRVSNKEGEPRFEAWLTAAELALPRGSRDRYVGRFSAEEAAAKAWDAAARKIWTVRTIPADSATGHEGFNFENDVAKAAAAVSAAAAVEEEEAARKAAIRASLLGRPPPQPPPPDYVLVHTVAILAM